MPAIYFVSWRVKEGFVDKAKELLKANFEHIDQQEKGNRHFATHQSAQDPRRFWMYEVWESQEAVDTHEQSDWFLNAYKAQLKPIVEDGSIIFDSVQILDSRDQPS